MLCNLESMLINMRTWSTDTFPAFPNSYLYLTTPAPNAEFAEFTVVPKGALQLLRKD